MKKLSLVILGLLMIFVLVACGSEAAQDEITQAVESPGVDAANSETLSPGRGTQSLQDSVRLMMGTFLLEDTDYAVTSEQASELVILWKAFRSLSSSDNVAAEEMDALVRQIRETMTPEQLETIAGMEITQGDMFAVAQELGIVPEDFGGFRRGEGDGEGFPEGGPGSFPGGGFPGGGFAGGQGPGGFRGDLDPDAIATARAERGGAQGFGGRFNSFLLDPLIELLESKIEA